MCEFYFLLEVTYDKLCDCSVVGMQFHHFWSGQNRLSEIKFWYTDSSEQEVLGATMAKPSAGNSTKLSAKLD